MAKLILTDVDLTILPKGQKVVPAKTLAALDAALAAGIHAGPASGRALPAIIPTFAGEERYVRTALATNGMQVYLDGELIHEEYLDHAGLVHVVDVARSLEGVGVICFEDGSIVHVACGELEDLAVAFPIYAKNPCFSDGIPEFPVVKSNIFVRGDMERTSEVMDIFKREVPELGFNLPLAGFLNITPVGYSKASGIDIMCDALGIGLDEVVVFGDGGNDIEMLEHVPNSVAVANATSEVSQVARYHIGSCDDEAVADAILALAAGEFPFSE